jgi:hypothetical protein
MGNSSKRKRATKRVHRETTLPEGEAGRILDKRLLEQVILRGEIL